MMLLVLQPLASKQLVRIGLVLLLSSAFAQAVDIIGLLCLCLSPSSFTAWLAAWSLHPLRCADHLEEKFVQIEIRSHKRFHLKRYFRFQAVSHSSDNSDPKMTDFVNLIFSQGNACAKNCMGVLRTAARQSRQTRRLKPDNQT